jgi:hypothetical protein
MSKIEKAWSALEMAEEEIRELNENDIRKKALLEEIRKKKEILRPQLKEDKKKRRRSRLILIALGTALMGIFLPQWIAARMGITGLALLKEVGTGEYKFINKILDKILGGQKDK